MKTKVEVLELKHKEEKTIKELMNKVKTLSIGDPKRDELINSIKRADTRRDCYRIVLL